MNDDYGQIPVEGDVLGDTYRIDRVLGQGGMGIVLAATHLVSGERFAVKLLLPASLEYPELVERFAREARAALRIQGPHMARVSEVGTLEDGRAFLVMEHLDGCDLREALRSHGALPTGEAALHVLEALEALAEAHAQDIVHRDLKPANLFLADQSDGSVMVKVLDFGISKVKGESNALTKTFDVIGTPFYMAPEQLTNARNVDERADIWSMGVILYELLTGRRPFEGKNMAEIVGRVLRNDAPKLTTLRPDLPKAFEHVIGRCLASERDDRFDDVGELAVALAPFAPDGGAHAARVVAARNRDGTPRRSKRPPAPPASVTFGASNPVDPEGRTEAKPASVTLTEAKPAAPMRTSTPTPSTTPRGNPAIRVGLVLAIAIVVLLGAWLATR